MAKVINTIVISDDPKGARRYSLDNSNCLLYVIPRDNLKDVTSNNDFPEIDWSCLYLLSNGDKCYIGQAKSFKNRVIDHKQKKDWWDYAYVFVSTSKDIDMEYLEYRALTDAHCNKSIEAVLDNKNTPKEHANSLEAKIKANKFYEDILFLASFVGCNVFIPTPETNEFIWVCEAKELGIKARGAFKNNVFTIQKGSIVRKDCVTSFKQKAERAKWIAQYARTNKDGYPELIKDYAASSPSKASSYVLGRTSNGWEEWKTEDGKKLSNISE